MADLDSCVMDLMYWSSLPGIPKKVKWPVRVNDWGNGNTGTVTVYCRSDDAYFTVQQSQLVAFPNSLKSWKEKGISALKNRKQTVTEFLTDIEWADEEIKMSSQDGHRENTKSSNGDGNHEQANSYARAYESLKSVCSDLNLKAPHQTTSVSMRKYTATLTQMLNLGKNQMEWVYQHLGHTKAVHKEHYRQMSGLLERTKISKMFLIQDLNLTGKFKDKTLEEIDIRDIVFGADEPVVEDDVPIDGNLSENLSVPENSIDPDEEGFSAEAAILDEEEDKEEEEDTEMQTETRNKKKSNRKKWVEGEIKELNKYFKEFFQTGTTPRRAFIDEIKKKSRKKGDCYI